MTPTKSLYDEQMEDPEIAELMAAESLPLAFTEKIRELMKEQGITRTKLAGLIGRSTGEVSRLLNGRDFRLSTLAKIFAALGHRVTIGAERIE